MALSTKDKDLGRTGKDVNRKLAWGAGIEPSRPLEGTNKERWMDNKHSLLTGRNHSKDI